MATLEDLLHLQAVHSMVLHLLPCLAQQVVPCVLLPMALQGVLRGLVIQVITCPNSPSKCVCDFSSAHHDAQLLSEQATQLRALY